MRKCCSVFIILISAVIFVGCRQTKNTLVPVTSNISFDAEIHNGAEIYTATGVIDKENKADFKIISPEKAKGLEFCISGDSASVKYADFVFNIENSNYFTSFKKIYNLLVTPKSQEITFTDNRYEYTSKIDGTQFTVIYSGTGLPIEIHSKNGDISVIFKNVTILN